MGNSNLRKAKKAKNDEFYTQLEDIEKELIHYKEHFKDKVVYCNCDLVNESNFFKYFVMHFNDIGLKKLITTNYKHSPLTNKRLKLNTAYCSQITRVTDADDLETLFNDDANKLYELKGDGDFASDECIDLLKEADIVISNPPFSIFRKYVAQLMEYDKKFIIIGPQNAITYKEIFPLLKDNKMWLGVKNGSTTFEVPNNGDYSDKSTFRLDEETNKAYITLGNICWYTNLDHKKRNEELFLFRVYSPEKYPYYDNYDAINVDKVADIPYDCEGVIGVPISFINKYNPKNFQLLGIMNTGERNEGIRYPNTPHGRPVINGKEKYLRVLIKHTEESLEKYRKLNEQIN